MNEKKKLNINLIVRSIGKRFQNDRSFLILTVSILVIFLTSLFASLIQSDFLNVKVSTVNFEARDNQVVVYDLYVPKSATPEDKAPLIVIIPGFQRTRETQGHIALELARRGYVVINIDPYSQGDSTSSAGVQGSAIASVEGYGSFDIIDYVYDNETVYPFVDKERIGVTGHSAGGNAAYQAAVYFGKRAVDNNGISKVHSVYITGYIISIDSSIAYAKSNIGLDFALYDEGAFRNKINPNSSDSVSKSDMTWSVEAHDLVNSGLNQNAEKPISLSEEIKLGYIYGNPNLRNMRQVFNTPTIHAFQPYDTLANSQLISFFETSFSFYNDYIEPTSMVWIYKEILTTISLIFSLILIVPLATILFRIPWFKSSIKMPIYNLDSRRKISIVLYIVSFVICASFAALMYLPASKLTLTLFKDASNSNNTWFFPQRMTNAVAVWAVLSGLFSMFIFTSIHFLDGYLKKMLYNDPFEISKSFDSWGVKTKLTNVLKTIIIGLIVAISYFVILMIIYSIFHVDFRFLFLMAARPINLKVVLQLLMYFPLFFVFYFSNSIRVNASQMNGKLREFPKLMLAGLINIAGLSILLIIQYASFASTGTVAFTELPDGTTQWLYINILFTLIPVMFLMPIFNRLFYKISGNTYLGPIIITIIFIIMSLNNSVSYIPI